MSIKRKGGELEKFSQMCIHYCYIVVIGIYTCGRKNKYGLFKTNISTKMYPVYFYSTFKVDGNVSGC